MDIIKEMLEEKVIRVNGKRMNMEQVKELQKRLKKWEKNTLPIKRFNVGTGAAYERDRT